jgi:hypothetical protein
MDPPPPPRVDPWKEEKLRKKYLAMQAKRERKRNEPTLDLMWVVMFLLLVYLLIHLFWR